MSKIRLPAVVIGLGIDFGGSIFVSIARVLAALTITAAVHGSQDLEILALRSAEGVPWRLVGVAGQVFFVGVGAYVAARMSHPNELLNALAVAILDLLIGAAMYAARGLIAPFWAAALVAALTLPAALIGGRLAARRAVAVSGA